MAAPRAQPEADCSDDSSQDCSIVSTVPDKYGFFGQEHVQTSHQPLSREVVLSREKKWLRMLSNWDSYMQEKHSKLRKRCRKGIPHSLRPRAWQFLCGAQALQQQYKVLYESLAEQPGDPKCLDDIKKDLHRQFPQHEMFCSENGVGQQELFMVLKAFSVLDPEVGYCQAQAPLAAFLLMHMPTEQAFWCLVSVCHKYLNGYYSHGMQQLQLDGDILFGLLKRVAPQVYRHLKRQKVEPVLYMTEWFLCAYTRTLPWSTVLRVWDMFLFEGVKVLFKVGLVLLKGSLQPRLKRCPTLYETLEAIRQPPPGLLEEEALVQHMLRLKLTEEDFQKEHSRQVAKRQKRLQH
ncbi:TBC1 domain family member whacked [Neocloeon triangulifer]|uniref:TBC1 domain family member whacked n=1 Tax=Neocloeon triangulifer TaxID=2078957 RepID=UPI00286F85EB|nr:TBC1 domain family member whacked [Neocloeon triangulifer]